MEDFRDAASGPFDLLVIMDATASMTTFVDGLNKSLPEVISISALTNCFERIGVLAYRDYCRGQLTEWSGWCCPSGKFRGPGIVSQDAVLNMARNMRTVGNTDWPEASKTGLAHGYSVMRSDATTLILLYTDAPPHFKETGSPNYYEERTALEKNTKYSESDSLFADWATAANTLRSGPKKCVVFSIISRDDDMARSPYLYLSTITGGHLFELERNIATNISQLTLGVLLTWMQLGSTVTGERLIDYIIRYKSVSGLYTARKEDDEAMVSYLNRDSYHGISSVATNIESKMITLGALPGLVEARGPNAGSFAERYSNDEDYKKLAADQLRRIIQTNVSAVSINPIFGSLWRTVCNDRSNIARDELIQLFGFHVEKLSDAAEKSRVKTWLAESYNFADEINHLIDSVAPKERFPLVFLDPTADFGTMAKNGEDGNEDEDEDATEQQCRPRDFTRAKLLEIGRSCDYKILRRLGRVLTRLTFIKGKDELPDHIEHMDGKSAVPCIPLALTKERYHRQFWKILLHAVLPGTKLAARPAALLAALTLRMGILPLRDVADQELLSFSNNWNTLDISETWNLGCLNLLLDADKDYEKRVADGLADRPTLNSRILAERDRDIFKSLVDYKMLELNLNTALQADIGWSPSKNKAPLGQVVACKKCEFPRSVTMMAQGGVCGLCDVESNSCDCPSCIKVKDHCDRLRKNVSAKHNEKSTAYWVECGQTSCHAQYVVYNPDALRVRLKCHFCRHRDAQGRAPLVECSKCLSRIIWPAEYRPDDLDVAKYQCAACLAGVETIVSEETSARKLTDENGRRWLLKNEDETIKETFNGMSVFHTASRCDLTNVAAKVEVLPATNKGLTIRGKLVRNSDDIKASLLKWVTSRRTESGTCSLCFSNFRQIINIAALRCPFCRRQPAPNAVRQFGIAHVGDLRLAIEESGSWIHAWCVECGFARRYVERVCAAGAPPELKGWRCDDCKPKEATDSTPMCPGCGVATEKTSGCDHITCSCGTHWCYACGKATEPSDIYMHIAKEHGGLGWDDLTDDDD